MFGYTKAEVVGQSIRVIVPPELYADEEDVLRRIRAGKGVDHYDTVCIRKDGHRLDVSVTVSPVATPDGRIIGVSKIARDITERRRLERDARHFAALVESSDDAIISKDLTGVITSWNVAAERMFGFTAAEMVGQSIRRLIPGDRQQEEDEVLSRIQRGERVEHYETVRQRKDGTFVPVSLTVSPIRSQDGAVVGASKIARDVSERERAGEERQRLLTIAREASRLKDEFLATLSHELRTPLNAIVGYVRMLQSGLLTGEKRTRALDTVARNVTSLTQIVEDVLDVSRIAAGKIRLNVQSLDLPVVMHDALATVMPAAEAKGVRIQSIVEPDIGPVSGDPERLQQVMWNLLSNAVKFTPRGGRVQVRLQRVNSHIEISVSDSGVGIREDFLPHLFERFRQADSTTTRAHGGLGLGLAIARQIVELHGGTIHAFSGGEGKGATFRIELPVMIVHSAVVVDAEPRVHPRTQVRVTPMHDHALNDVRVLAVDDDADALTLVREILETAGAQVFTAASAPAALAVLEEQSPDVLISDLGMPGMDGFELIQRVRTLTNEKKDIPAAALTAYARSEDRARALRTGFEMHLAKPIDPSELIAAVVSLARRRSGATREN
jgi:PAS domain S-box-containing protein